MKRLKWRRLGQYAKEIEKAGADALELNIYYVAKAFEVDSALVERRILEIVSQVKSAINIPVAVKLSPYLTALRNFAVSLVKAGASGLVLFNRFYQPDIDIEELEAVPTLKLSDSSELLLRLRWAAILHKQIDASIAITGGVHTGADAIKAVMAGADSVQIVSAALQNGARSDQDHPRGHEGLDAEKRVRVTDPNERQHEPAKKPQSRGL